MTSYRNEAWDGGPPGAEGDYAPQPAPSLPPTMPTTDPWTGVSYTQYPSQYDYQPYGATQYGYSYDSSYYQRPDGYYDSSRPSYPGQYQSGYGYAKAHSQSVDDSRNYGPRRTSFKSKSRSPSPYGRRDREYSKRDNNYEKNWKHSKRRSLSKRKYTPSRSSSRSYSRSPINERKNRRSVSSGSYTSKKSYRHRSSSVSNRSLTPPIRRRNSRSRSTSDSSKRNSRRGTSKNKKEMNRSLASRRSRSISPRIKLEKDRSRSPKIKVEKNRSVSPFSKAKTIHGKEAKFKEKKPNVTLPRKATRSPSPRARVKIERPSITPPKRNARDRAVTPPKKASKERRSMSPKKPRDSSVTPPRRYARSSSSSKSRSSRSMTPKPKSRSRTKSRRRSSSSDSYSSRKNTRSNRRQKRRSISKQKSRSRSRTRERHRKSRSTSRRRSPKSKGRRSRSSSGRSKSRSRSRSAHSSIRSGTKSPSDDERRGQFTVADRKRYWKLHRYNQGSRAKSPKEIKPPPGAIEVAKADEIDYGDPPEVEGLNFAELLPPPDQLGVEGPSNSRTNKPPLPIPIKNDGSFLEMFKKLQEETKKQEEVKKPLIKKPALPFIGKRRGGRVLKTGLVKKAKAIDEQTVDNTPKDAWSLYMQEVKKYRETSCEEERKTRPLVK